MKKFSFLFIALFTVALFTTSCREEKTVEVETLAPDVEDGNEMDLIQTQYQINE